MCTRETEWVREMLRVKTTHLAFCPAVAGSTLLFLSPASGSQASQSLGLQPSEIELGTGSHLSPLCRLVSAQRTPLVTHVTFQFPSLMRLAGKALNKFYIIGLPACKKRIPTRQWFTLELFAGSVMPGVQPFVWSWQAMLMKSKRMAECIKRII